MKLRLKAQNNFESYCSGFMCAHFKCKAWSFIRIFLFLSDYTIGRFHVKGPRKKVNVKKCFNEMWKILGQIDDFYRFLNNSCNLGVFLAKNQKYPKMTVLKKWKLKKRRKKNFRLKKLCQISYIIFLYYEFYDFVNLFCHLQCFRPFF